MDSLREPLFSSLGRGVRNFAVSAPTGSGKSTRLPAMLAEKIGGKILVLQPRRVAARMLAKFVARAAGSKAGEFAGWHIRLDKNYSETTKIVFLTEGVLARMALSDPGLKGVGAIVFDEFHERNIFGDISLALALNSQKKHRPDLVLAVASASMDSGSVLGLLGDGAESLECGSRMFPVDIRYAPAPPSAGKIWDAAALEFSRLAREGSDGNFLIFMPGAYEISKTISALKKIPAASDFDIYPLHGSIPADLQDRAVQESARRKIVVATNIAETSLTIGGVKYVIDSGLAKVSRYDPSRGVNTLLTERISLASALQRAGRAGRTSAGVAVRLWKKSDEADFKRHLTPEILRLELSQTLLWLKCAGLDFCGLPLLDKPSAETAAGAERLLRELGALDSSGRPTKLGRVLGEFPSEPRFAKMLLESVNHNCLESVSLIAGVVEAGPVKAAGADARAEGELQNMLDSPPSELEENAAVCLLAKSLSFDEAACRRLGIHALNARRAFEFSREFFRTALQFSKSGVVEKAKSACEKNSPEGVRLSVLSAFSDRVCARLNEGTLACRIVGGKRGEVRKSSKKYASKIFAALDLSEQANMGRVSIMLSDLCPIEEGDLRAVFPNDFSEKREVSFEESAKRVMVKRSVAFRDLPIFESFSDSATDSERAEVFAGMIMNGALRLKNWGEAEDSFIERVNFAAELCPESGISKIDDAAKRAIFENMCLELSSYSEIKSADVLRYLKEWISGEELALLDYLAPYSVELPNRRRPVKIRYELSQKRAVVSSKFSDFYGYDGKNLKIADGKIAPTFEILAPNGRPVQITQNLGEFWKTSWLNVKKELKARYPKHFKNERGA